MAQTNYYPCYETPASLCTTCNSGLTSPQGTNGTNGPGAGSGSCGLITCSTYCNASCNSRCESDQSYCYIGHQYIKNHGDVGAYPGKTVKQMDYIKDHWTATYWNSLIAKLNAAEIVGQNQPQGSTKTVGEVKSETQITAQFYNDIEAKLANFHVSYDTVKKDETIISAAIANAVQTAYNSATFNSSVCDVCNAAGSQSKKTCSCNCPTCSTCPSCSSCPSCSCNCSSCSGCYCSACPTCACPTCASPSETKT